MCGKSMMPMSPQMERELLIIINESEVAREERKRLAVQRFTEDMKTGAIYGWSAFK